MPANDTLRKKSETLFQMITQARFCVALTGAGVSTLSGIRDFRGKNGLYREVDAEKMFDIDYFYQDPSYYYKAAGTFIYNVKDKQPSIVHTTLAKLEERGFLRGLITQNVDLLHQRGGSKRVIEIHGSPSIHYCLHCSDRQRVEELASPGPEAPGGVPVLPSGGDLMGFDEAAALVKAGELPRCGRCGRVLKPAVTFFGEGLPVHALAMAQDLARRADLMLVLGTSLMVYPAADLPKLTLRAGGRMVIVNDMVTPLDSLAAMGFDDLESLFIEINDHLVGLSPG
jgi:NAD-dependent deacetylase